MANRFLNNITINDSYTFPNADGTADQIIKTDGAGQLSFIDQGSLAAGSAESTHILVKNTSGAQIAKGTPVYVTGETGNSGKIEIAPADAPDEDKMPALGLLETTLNDNTEGYCVQGGLLEALATTTIDGTSTTANDTVYIKAGGGLTMTKPTGSNFIQNIAKVARVHASNGSLVVSSILRTNDVPTPLYIDHANQRLGIGAPSPDTQLEIKSSTGGVIRLTSSDTSVNTGESIGRLEFKSNDVSTGGNNVMGFVDCLATNAGTTYALALGTGLAAAATEKMRIDSSGNVGIGTDNPGQKLHVSSNDQSTARIRLSNTNTGSGGDNIDLVAGVNSVTQDGFSIYNATSNQTQLVIQGGGNVGIGTTSPAEKLAIDGSIRIPRTEEFYWTDGSVNGSPRAVIFSTSNEFGGDYNGIGFSVGANGRTAPSMYIRGTGNVGIGTTSPGSKLDVNQDDSSVALNVTGGGGGASLATFTRDVGATGSSVSINAQSNFPQIQFANTGNTFSIGGDTSGNFKISDNTAIGTNDRITIDNTGNVGIGTTDPAEKLHVYNGSAYITPITYAANQNDWVIRTGAYNNTAFDQGLKIKSTSGGVSYMAFETAHSGGETMVLRSGNVGIGLDNPSSKLHVSGAIQNDQFIIPNTAGSNGKVLAWPATGTTLEWVDQSSGGGGIAGTIAATQVAYGTGTDTIGGHSGLTYNGAGVLTATQIQCTSSIYVASNIYRRGDTNTSINFALDQIDLYAGGLKMITCDEGSTDEVIINENSADINFRVESDVYTHMFFVDAGLSRVGIVQNNPGYTLDVNGDAYVATNLTIGNGNLVLNGNGRIQGVDTVTSGTDAANKSYVDNAIAGVSGGGGDTYSINAGAKSGNNVPINLDAASGTDTLINLTQGTGITLTRNSSNQITIAASGGGGGGSSTLSGLSDVTISSLQNNDLLMYNSTASEWQNTNLGLTVTPTLSGASTGYATLQYTLTVSNHATYDDPAYYVEVYNTSGSVVVANSAITNNYDGTFTFALPSAAASYTIQVRAQDFGDLQSEIATKTITVSLLSLNYQYFRVTNFTGTASTNSIMIRDFRLYTSAGQSGTQLPPNMTSNTAPTPYVASGQGQYSASYDPYKAFDSSASSQWWNLSGNNTTDYLQIDLGQAYTIKSFRFREGSTPYSWTGCTVQASNTGAFNGEEVEVVLTGLTALYPSYKNAG